MLMSVLRQSYRGLRLVMLLNLDRILALATIALALALAAFVGGL